MSSTSIKKVVKLGGKFQWLNGLDKLDEQTREFVIKISENDPIRRELGKIIEGSPLFKNLTNNNNIPNENISNNNNNDNIVDNVEYLSSGEQEKLKEKLNITIEEEGDKHNLVYPEYPASIEEIQKSMLGFSVFSDINRQEISPYSSSSIMLSSGKQSSLSSNINLISKKNSGISNAIKRKSNKPKINENANFGSLPSSSSDLSVWATVNNWMMKAFRKIQKYTTDFLSYLSKMWKSILIEFGILILGIALLYSAGIIPNPTFYFKMFYQSLIKFLYSLF